MMLFGLEFPRDRIQRPDQGPVWGLLISLHPFVLWGPAIILSALIVLSGLLLK